MYRFFWTLPGPSSFLEKVTTDLKDGRIVFMIFPLHFPAEAVLLSKILLKEVLGEKHWCEINLEQEQKKPIDAIFKHLIGEQDKFMLRNISRVLESEILENTICWCNRIPQQKKWDEWLFFFNQLQHQLQNYPPFRRLLFCIPLQEVSSLSYPISDTCLAVHSIKGVISQLDMSLWASWLLREQQLEPFLLQVVIAVITELSGTDIHLCYELSNQPLETIFNPFDFLVNYKQEILLSSDAVLENEQWKNGAIYFRNNRSFLHSIIYTQTSDYDAIERRVWRGQVGVLFPLIEDIRQEIIKNYSTMLSVPHERLSGEKITLKSELELGDIKYQLSKKNGRVRNRKLFDLIDISKEIRDKLAHFKHVDVGLLSRKELLEFELFI